MSATTPTPATTPMSGTAPSDELGVAEPGRPATALPAELRTARWFSPAEEVVGKCGKQADAHSVELACTGDTVALRDSARPGGPYLIFDSGEWEAFLIGVGLGEFDMSQLASRG